MKFVLIDLHIKPLQLTSDDKTKHLLVEVVEMGTKADHHSE